MTTLMPSTDPVSIGGDIAVPPLGWGMWRLKGTVAQVRALIAAARDAGITLFDTADIYGFDTPAGFGSAESLLGEALAGMAGMRDEIVVATKGGIRPGIPYNSSGAYLADAIDASLRRLRVERIDLYQIHRRDMLAHPAEVARALETMVAAGKVRAIGVSNHSPAEREALQAHMSLPIVSTQPEFSPLHTAPMFDGTLDQAMTRSMAVLAWSPLGGGRLATGDHPAAASLAEQGARYDADIAAAAMSWAMVHPARIIPIVGSQNPERVRRAADAFRIGWTRPEWYKVLEAGLGTPLP